MIIALRQLAAERAEARAGRAADQSALHAAAEDSAECRAAAAADQRAVARTDAASMVIVVMVAVILLVALVVVASAHVVPHAAVIVAIAAVIVLAMVVLGQRAGRERQACGAQQGCGREPRVALLTVHAFLLRELDGELNPALACVLGSGEPKVSPPRFGPNQFPPMQEPGGGIVGTRESSGHQTSQSATAFRRPASGSPAGTNSCAT